jgi:hypothetical protein
MLIHVSLETRRAAPPGGVVAEGLERAMAGQSALERPEGLRLGRV